MSRISVIRLLLFAGLVSVMVSCRSNKAVSMDDFYEESEETSAVSEKSDIPDISEIIAGSPEWTDVIISGNMTVGMGSSLKSAVVVRMIKDKSVSISIRPMLGIEMGKIYFEGDTVTVVDKYHKAYMKESVGNVLGDYLDVPALQSLLLSYPFLIGGGALCEENRDDFEAVPDEDGGYSILPKRQPEVMEYGFDMDGYNIRHFNMSLKSNGAAYSVNFSGFKVTENGRIATSVKSDIPLAGANAFFELNYKSVKWDNGVSDSVTVPSGARRYAFSDIMKLISQQ